MMHIVGRKYVDYSEVYLSLHMGCPAHFLKTTNLSPPPHTLFIKKIIFNSHILSYKKAAPPSFENKPAPHAMNNLGSAFQQYGKKETMFSSVFLRLWVGYVYLCLPGMYLQTMLGAVVAWD